MSETTGTRRPRLGFLRAVTRRFGTWPLFGVILVWVVLALVVFTVLGWLWGEGPLWSDRWLTNWRGAGAKANPLDVVKVSLTTIGGIGGTGYLVIKYRERASAERAERDAEQDRAEQRLLSGAQQLGSGSPQVRIAGVYSLASVADTYRGEYRQRVVSILCGYLRTQRGEWRTIVNEQDGPEQSSEEKVYVSHDGAVESTVLEVLVRHLRKHCEAVTQLVEDDQLWCDCTIDLHDAVLTEIADFRGATFTNNADFRGATFNRYADFERATFNRYAYFRGATFNRYADFERATFTNNADFGGATFTNNANFGDATFTNNADFRGATFTNNANFRGATFNRYANFRGATFTNNAYFRGATFNRYADFGDATFTNDAYFGGATFTNNANFRGATFTNDAYFGGATFTNDADFGGATFTNANFQDATFNRYADFRGATFNRYADFRGATFTNDAYFGGATFTNNANFRGATFTNANFRGATFTNNVDFGGATFTNNANFQDATFTRSAPPKGLPPGRVDETGLPHGARWADADDEGPEAGSPDDAPAEGTDPGSAGSPDDAPAEGTDPGSAGSAAS